jgi:hypothetical protein
MERTNHRQQAAMSEFCERVLSSVIGLPHGGILCWVGRIACLAWVLCHMFMGVFVLAYGAILGNPFLAVLLIGLVTGLAGLRWHLVSTVLLIVGGLGGVLCVGAALLISQSGQSPLIPILFAMAVVSGGIVNLMAWLNERRR